MHRSVYSKEAGSPGWFAVVSIYVSNFRAKDNLTAKCLKKGVYGRYCAKKCFSLFNF